MSTLTTKQKARILSEGAPLTAQYNTASSDNAIVSTTYDGDTDTHWAVGVNEGSATITAHRVSDGEEATLDVTVEAPPFTIALDTPEPK